MYFFIPSPFSPFSSGALLFIDVLLFRVKSILITLLLSIFTTVSLFYLVIWHKVWEDTWRLFKYPAFFPKTFPDLNLASIHDACLKMQDAPGVYACYPIIFPMSPASYERGMAFRKPRCGLWFYWGVVDYEPFGRNCWNYIFLLFLIPVQSFRMILWLPVFIICFSLL